MNVLTRSIRVALPALAALLLGVAPDLRAEAERTAGERPRVGLVLGGGGARGAAHIGVLKELERLQVPIDAIAGTSMGAIVGGLYASGMSADELEALIGSLDWAAALSDQPLRDELSFRRKQDDREFPIRFELGVKGTDLVLPQGVVKGQRLDLLLRELTLRAAHIDDFDDLPIPFRAVAADISAGEAVVLGDGDLAAAIRASMSVPGFFTPALIDDRLLVDGGIVGNLPIDIARAMGVDVVIAVDVEFPLYASEELDSVLKVSEQVLTILIRKETRRQIETLSPRDVLIQPQLGTFASTNFGEIDTAVAPGVEAARLQAEKLGRLALDAAAWRQHLAARQLPDRSGDRLAFVRVEHDGTLSGAVIESRIDVEPGDPIDPQRLAANANRLFGLRLYEQVAYRLVEEDGATGVQYTATEKSWGPALLQFGLSLEDDFDGSTGFNLAARYTRGGLNRLGAEWRTDLQLGTDPALTTEYYQPLSFDSRYFLAPRIDLSQSNFNVYSGNRRLGRYRLTDGQFSLDFGRELGTIGELRFGAFRGVGNARVKVGDPALPGFDYDSGGLFGRLRIDTVDDAQFPRQGLNADLQWTLSRPGLGAQRDFDAVELDVSQTFSRGKSSLQLGLSYASTLRNTESIQDFFPLGGFLRLSGLERGEIAGPHAGLARLVYYRRVGDSTGGVFETPLYLGASIEAGNVWESRADIGLTSLQLNGSVFAGLDSYFGPVFLAAGFAENGESNFYLFIGEPPR